MRWLRGPGTAGAEPEPGAVLGLADVPLGLGHAPGPTRLERPTFVGRGRSGDSGRGGDSGAPRGGAVFGRVDTPLAPPRANGRAL